MNRDVPDVVTAAGFNELVGNFDKNATGWPEPSAYIQWKGTLVCMDFHCECGANCHFDGAFAYTVKCPHCETIWQMPDTFYPRKADERTYQFWRENPKLLECDEDFGK